jgi:phenylpropionate dioxygenase-like ring-hydroxylating dioxygenase large terminal subunit
LFLRDPLTRVRVDSFDGGFRSNMMKDDQIRHHVDFVYPNLWFQNLSDGWTLAVTFAPIDESRTEVYYRWYHRIRSPLLQPFVNLWGRFTNFLVFHEDMAILATQRPANVDDASIDKLVPSDAAQIEYRKMRALHQKELDENAKGDNLSAVS